jgi:hypothetical protein
VKHLARFVSVLVIHPRWSRLVIAVVALVALAIVFVDACRESATWK